MYLSYSKLFNTDVKGKWNRRKEKKIKYGIRCI